MKKSSALAVGAIVCLLLTMVFAYLWCTITTPAATVFSILVLVTAVGFLVCVSTFNKM